MCDRLGWYFANLCVSGLGTSFDVVRLSRIFENRLVRLYSTWVENGGRNSLSANTTDALGTPQICLLVKRVRDTGWNWYMLRLSDQQFWGSSERVARCQDDRLMKHWNVWTVPIDCIVLCWMPCTGYKRMCVDLGKGDHERYSKWWVTLKWCWL